MAYDELSVQQAENRMRQIFDLFTDLSEDRQYQLEEVLKKATKLVEMDVGIISNIVKAQYVIQDVYTDGIEGLEKGQTFDLGHTYCSITFQNNNIVDISNVGMSEFKGHPCYIETNLESYIGVPIYVNNKRYGTLNFSSPTPKKVAFNQFDRDFVMYLGQWIGQHITRVTYEQKLSEKNKELRKLLQERKKLTSILIHDLKSPLNSLTSLIDLSSSVAENEMILDLMKKSLGNAFDLIKNLQEVNQLEQGLTKYEPAQTDAIRIANEVISDFQSQAIDKEIDIKADFSSTNLPVTTDEKLLIRILSNLLSNAIKFSEAKSAIIFTVNSTENTIIFSIKDHGPGIGEEDQKKMFERFQKLSARPTANEHSSGLGLFIVKELTHLINGKIDVRSDLGSGSTFTVSISKT